MADILSLEGDGGRRCVDIVPLGDGSFGYKEFRRDPEDGGCWTLVADHTGRSHESRAAAIGAAADRIAWLREDCADEIGRWTS